MDEESKKFFTDLIHKSQEVISSDMKNQINGAEANLTSQLARDIKTSQETLTTHFEEKLANTQTEVTNKVEALRIETSSNHQSTFSSISNLTNKVNQVHALADDYRVEASIEAGEIRQIQQVTVLPKLPLVMSLSCWKIPIKILPSICPNKLIELTLSFLMLMEFLKSTK